MKQQIDWPGFVAACAIIVLTSVPLALFPEASARIIENLYDVISHNLAFLYLMAGMGVMLLLMWLALGRYGKVRLAAGDEQPEFSDFSWAAMLFCTGVGAGLLFWAPLEWAYYLDTPPFGVAAGSIAATEWAATYGIFHWGPTAWGFYCLPTLAIAYPYYVKKVPFLRLSTSCHYFFGGMAETRSERLIDWLFMIGLLGGAASSLGFSTPMIAALVGRVAGLEANFNLELAVIFVSVVLFATSVWLGLRKGIKRLSDLNIWLAVGLLVFILLAGPTIFLLKSSLNSVGLMLQNFIRMNSWTDPYTASNFVENWTIFYWAWWIAFGPFVGVFVTRISQGRTIRQVVFGMLGYGSLGGGLFYMILGNYGLHLQLEGTVAVTQVLADSGGPAAIVAILDQLPMSTLLISMYAIVALVFSATTYDSASYTLASVATRQLLAGEEPARWHRVFWAVMLAILPVTLIFVGGIKVAQTATLIVSLPLIFVGVLMAVALVRQLRADHP
ncbi:MAG: BCCT family transporter [Xanthomonadales bacterium]|nr:BCCT family transporter [Xanthomonadales bacterium]